MTLPVAVAWSSNGTLSIFDLGTPKVLRIGADDAIHSTNIAASFVAPVIASGELHWAGIQSGGAVLLYPGWKHVGPDDAQSIEAAILRLGAGSEQPDTLIWRTLPAISESRIGTAPAPGWARPAVAIGMDGRMAVGGFDETYRILVYDSSGVALHQICGVGYPLPRTATERGQIPAPDMEGAAEAVRNAVVPSQFAAYGRLVVGTDETVWVQRDRQQPVPGPGSQYGEPGALFDVYDSTGQYTMTARLPAAAYLLDVKGDTVWTFAIGEYDEIEVVAFQRKR